MTPIDRAERAKALLEDMVLKGAFEDIKTQLVSNLESLPISDHETQHEIALMLQLLKRIRSQLQTYLNEAAIDKAKAKQDSFIEKMRERFIA